jgi:predicted phage terminase large subunit-like protein
MRISNIDLLEMLAITEARESFWAYRQLINPKLITGWWQREMAKELQTFYESFMAGERPKLVIEAPPQHGKSRMVGEFITWLAGKNPDCRTIYTSFSERLGVRANLTCQRIYDSKKYQKIFPDTKINESNAVTISGQTLRNREMLEYVNADGFFRNTTVLGSITGEALDLGVIDDPIKGRDSAGSKTVRDKTWDWFTDDFFTRFSENAGMLAILTRWHVDDPIGRLREKFKDKVKVVSYPAIAVKDEKHRKEGEALFPELKSLEFLLERKAAMSSVNWEALYQQNPQILGGELIKGEWFGRYREMPKIKHRTIYADTAQKTAERNDYSVLECWGMGEDGKIYLIDLIRGKWEAPELERRAVSFWEKHHAFDSFRYGQLRQLKIEDKASGTGLIQGLKLKARIPVAGIERTKDKYTRLMDVLGYIESGYVMIPEYAQFTNDFITECEAFTSDNSHIHDDQVDPMMDAICDMLQTKKSHAFTEAMI